MHVKYEWDEAKRVRNLAKHGIDFTAMERFGWDEATFGVDDRADYGEVRVVSAGYIGDRLHLCAWTPREDVVRVITLRKANDREQAEYDRARAADRR